MSPPYIPFDDTYMLLARQGYAAQSRRQSVGRARQKPDDMPFGGSNRDSQQTLLASDYGSYCFEKPESAKSTSTISMSPPGSPLFESHSSIPRLSRSMSTSLSCSPHSPNITFNDETSTHVVLEAMEEADGEDGVVIHNGIKRLSLRPVGGCMSGKPRLVNI